MTRIMRWQHHRLDWHELRQSVRKQIAQRQLAAVRQLKDAAWGVAQLSDSGEACSGWRYCRSRSISARLRAMPQR